VSVAEMSGRNLRGRAKKKEEEEEEELSDVYQLSDSSEVCHQTYNYIIILFVGNFTL
jgi:hypothetical protein